MQHTYISQLKVKLESEAGITFSKVDTLRWVSYDGDIEIVFARTLGQCVAQTAKELGE
ncbi:hypothetical protein vB_PsyM_KIL3b_0129 [Pseudomonas phage vB_PsyM_KIL3b]|uniref:Uncharacterized protein n=4 Tax=Pseudomonas phage vB_PsyM_KIL1 TaxID=1777065 RepID=A0A142IE81_9CAUD|nr:hypothetical protein vB_PsyM_KIL2_0136 [Pseudomonas phage vB_PsyM_KIL2]AMR57696.1 hypothetical protein vB_PsyM_KIL3_0129 [Pseudomonas phage vB_PsyM_KIL3]AMR58027.1 hypothetical protein vB_PsyM_KIL5_0136 [Pseudomonas phage vB_PsyM_KIL5]AMR58194.1 hypothetical protein vB_PsyM_KIL3b_0129 [Pseudomonas phage vB_PsyM_KIL3b]